jgi:hypothetical protein
MSANELVTFREFHDRELLLEFTHILKDHDIPFKIEDTRPRFDVTFSNDQSRLIYMIRVKREDLGRARQIGEAVDLETMKELPSDYYLFTFPDDELKNILATPNDWSAFDVLLAEKLLRERGVELKPEVVRELKTVHTDLLDTTPETEYTFLVVFGYIISALGFFIPLLLFLGFIIPILLLVLRKKTPEGKRIPYFSEVKRQHAKVMFIITISILLVFTQGIHF